MQNIQQLLSSLKQELQTLQLWQISRPSIKALSSTQPFGIDTLSFEQWLQFIFIERMETMVKAGQPLPTAISICPIAEEKFKHLGDSASKLINLIADIDQLLSGKREQTLYVN